MFNDEEGEYRIPEVRRVNWEILSPGEYPWVVLRDRLRPIIEVRKQKVQPFIEHRLHVLCSFNPTIMMYGLAGFSGYLCFYYKELGIAVWRVHYLITPLICWGRIGKKSQNLPREKFFGWINI